MPKLNGSGKIKRLLSTASSSCWLTNVPSSEPFSLYFDMHPRIDKSNDTGFFTTQNSRFSAGKSPTIATNFPLWGSISKRVHWQTKKPWYDSGFPHKNNEPTVDCSINCRSSYGAEDGTWTHTPECWLLRPARLPFRHFRIWVGTWGTNCFLYP